MESGDITAPLLIKLGVVAAIFAALPLKQAVVVMLVVVLGYRYVVAAALGLQVMDIMSLNTFSTGKKATVNVMSMTIVTKSEAELAHGCFSRLAKTHLKMRCRIVEVFGDYYY